MRFIQRYKKPEYIGVGDNVRFKNNEYQVLINYIKGDQDRKGFIQQRILLSLLMIEVKE